MTRMQPKNLKQAISQIFFITLGGEKAAEYVSHMEPVFGKCSLF